MSFDVLMQNFYKVTQSTHEKVPSFATRLEGTLNQIRLQCPRRIMDWEVQQHLKDHLFHGLHKHIRDLIQYFYSNPGTTYPQLMVTAHKVESKNEETQEKVWARSAVTTKPVEGATELMAALTRAGQGNIPSSTLNSPRHRGCGRGRTDRKTPSHPNSHNGWTGLGQTTSVHSVSAGHGTGTTGQSQGNVQGSKDNLGCTSNMKDASSLQCFRCQGWGHVAWWCATPAKSLNQFKGNWGNAAQPPPAPTTAANSRLPAFPPWPQTKSNHTQSDTEERMTRGCPCPFSKSWSSHLVSGTLLWGPSNNRWKGNNHTNWFRCSGIKCELPILWGTHTANSAIRSVIGARWDRRCSHPIPWYMEVNLQIPGITNYNEDVLLLVIPTTTYSKAVPVVEGGNLLS